MFSLNFDTIRALYALYIMIYVFFYLRDDFTHYSMRASQIYNAGINYYKTRKSCSETNMKAALRYRQWAISNLI